MKILKNVKFYPAIILIQNKLVILNSDDYKNKMLKCINNVDNDEN